MSALARLFGRRASGLAEPALRPDALPPGTLLGALRIEQALARGASAALYRATDTASGETVAVKALCPSPGSSGSNADTERFLREGERACALQHPHIVRVWGGGQASGVAFIAMELLPGHDLTRWTAPEHRLPEAAVLDLAAQLADALAHAHRQGVVHRDVKPANVIYDPSTRRAVLTDFGLARGPDADATRSGVMLGSPAYMAPELLAGAPPDARSDLYALGVLVFELLAGRPPFDHASLGQLLRAVALEAPPRLADLRPELRDAAELDRLLAPLLAKSAAERPADGAAWAAQARLERVWLTAPPAA
jgi:eukaryotic-like serine/threonine-protein kinase